MPNDVRHSSGTMGTGVLESRFSGSDTTHRGISKRRIPPGISGLSLENEMIRMWEVA